MCWEKRISRYPWIEDYYTKEKNFQVRCREQSCKKSLRYVQHLKHSENKKFKEHLRNTHKEFYEHEEKNELNMDWKYFRLTKEKNTECTLCDTDVIEFSPNDDLSEHVKKHLDRQQVPTYQEQEDWHCKYLKQIGDFSAKCKLCANTTKILKFTFRLTRLKIHLKIHNVIIKLGDKPYMSWKYQTELQKNYFLNKCYTKPVNFKSKCQFCKQKTAAFDTRSFQQHYNEDHPFIYKTEESNNEMKIFVWKYFKFTKQEVKEEIECILCVKTMQNDDQIVRNHINSADHIRLQSSTQYNVNQSWTYKYVRQEEDIVKCMICEENINYHFRIDLLKVHIKLMHEKDFKRINKEKDFWNSQTKKNSWLQKCYTDAGDFRAKCKFCECKEIYIKNEQFEKHVSEAHGLIHFFETYCKSFELYQDQWKYLRYTNNMNMLEPETECMICQKTVSLPHLNHCPQELKSYSHHWALKYAKQNENCAECTICKKDVSFDYDMDNLKNHMSSVHREEWKRIQEDLEQGTAHQAGPSTSYAN